MNHTIIQRYNLKILVTYKQPHIWFKCVTHKYGLKRNELLVDGLVSKSQQILQNFVKKPLTFVPDVKFTDQFIYLGFLTDLRLLLL